MNINEMEAGRELDMLVAEKVMGYQCVCDDEPRDCPIHARDDYDTLLAYSTDIDNAWDVVTQMRASFFLERRLTRGMFWHAVFDDCGDGTWQDEVRVHAEGATAPLTICRAALKFIEAMEGKDERR